MIRHSIIRLTVIVSAAFYLCCLPLRSTSQQRSNRVMQQKTAALLGDYCISFRSSDGILRYILRIDSVHGMFFYGRMENDKRYHPKRNDQCYIKGLLAPKGKYEFVMKPWIDRDHPCTLPCAPYDWLLNNKVYFSIAEENIIRGYMVVQNAYASPLYKFAGMRQELPENSLAEHAIVGR